MVFAASCAIAGCHSANSVGAAGLDSASAGVVGRLLGQGPSTNVAAGAACASVGKPYLVAGSNPATGLLMDKMDSAKVTCGSTMSVLAPAQLVPAHLPFGLGDRCHDGSHHAMTIRSATMLAARVALLVPLLVGATGGSALGAGGKRAGVPKFDGAQEVVVRKQVMKVLKAHGCELAKSREMELGVANTGALLESDDGFAKVAKELALSVIVTGEIGRKRAKITVHDGRDGSVLGQAAFPGANPRKMAAEVARHVLEQARRRSRTRPRAAGREEGAEGRGGGPGRRRKRARRG